MDDHKRLWWQAFLAGLANTEGNVSHRVEHSTRVAQESVSRYHAQFGSDAPTDAPYEGWAHLEVMGHREHYGRVREIRAYGTRMIEIQCLNDKGEFPGDATREVHQYGGSAIFCNTPMDEETCRHGARHEELCRCRHTNDQGYLDCDKKVWASTTYEAYCDEHRPKEDDDGELAF